MLSFRRPYVEWGPHASGRTSMIWVGGTSPLASTRPTHITSIIHQRRAHAFARSSRNVLTLATTGPFSLMSLWPQITMLTADYHAVLRRPRLFAAHCFSHSPGLLIRTGACTLAPLIYPLLSGLLDPGASASWHILQACFHLSPTF